MFGYLRFFLAILVFLSHVGFRVNSLNPGVFAVVVFYILAGYVTTYLFFEVIPQKRKILNFYKDRVIRIFPLYLIILFLTLLFILITGYGKPNFNPTNTLSNLFIIPLNYYMYIDVNILTEPKWPLIPPAWSLGTELQAYIILPFLLLSKRLFFISFFISFIIYTLANISFLHPDYFGYRLICGVLFFFLIGVLLRKKEKKSLKLIYFTIFFEAFMLFVTKSINKDSYTIETLLGLLVGIPLIWLLSNKKDIVLNKILGRLSYAIFLLHFLFIWIFDYLNLLKKDKIYLILLLFSILLLSFVLVKVETYIKTKLIKI